MNSKAVTDTIQEAIGELPTQISEVASDIGSHVSDVAHTAAKAVTKRAKRARRWAASNMPNVVAPKRSAWRRAAPWLLIVGAGGGLAMWWKKRQSPAHQPATATTAAPEARFESKPAG